jgi:hypothetical protein
MKSDQYIIFKKDLDRMGTSKGKQKALLHRERKENAINTHRLEIQKVIVFFKFSGTLPTYDLDSTYIYVSTY